MEQTKEASVLDWMEHNLDPIFTMGASFPSENPCPVIVTLVPDHPVSGEMPNTFGVRLAESCIEQAPDRKSVV